jgi:hypothetical protein
MLEMTFIWSYLFHQLQMLSEECFLFEKNASFILYDLKWSGQLQCS